MIRIIIETAFLCFVVASIMTTLLVIYKQIKKK
jgi:hypothetical protein